MNFRPFREHHLITLLERYEQQHLPLDLFISHYFREHKALGSKDRGEIAENIYGMIRWKGLLDYLVEKPSTWDKRLALFQHCDPLDYLEDEGIPLNVRLSFPKSLYALLARDYGEELARELCLASNQPAPTTVRINPLKTTRQQMLDRWNAVHSISACKRAPLGITFHKKINFFSLPEFTEGLFEVQDEGSQLLASLVEAKPGDQILDYCAGSGGKSLAFAHLSAGQGQLYIHDIRPYILAEAKKRFKRAGIQNFQLLFPDDAKKMKLKRKMDWVLVDAPCTGTGTMRRNPDMKWKFTEEAVHRLAGEQRKIFEQALSYVKPGGRIVYGTCSLLHAENEEQVRHFLDTYPLELAAEPFKTLPAPGEMDGFFGAVFIKH